MLLIFEKDQDGAQYDTVQTDLQWLEVTGSWKLKMNHINGSNEEIELEQLRDLASDQSTRNFAGNITYTKTIHIESENCKYIDLGDVQGITELSLNGIKCGTRWYGQQIFDISHAKKSGENQLSIKLTTITGNYLKGQVNNVTAQRWTGGQTYYPMGIIGPVRIHQIS